MKNKSRPSQTTKSPQKSQKKKGKCQNCKKEFDWELKWKFQLKPNYQPRLCPECSDKETKENLSNLNRGIGW